VKKAEISIAAFFCEHNSSILSCEHLVKVVKRAAKDSAIVKDVKLGRTKCSAIVRNVIAKTETEALAEELQKTVFSVMIDESTDVSNKKNMCILVRYVSSSSKKLITTLLELVELDAHDCSAQSLWDAFEKCLEKHQIPLTNIVGYACDNASVMTGVENSFWTRLKQKCPWVVLLKCICHSSALVSKEACSKLPSFVEDTLRGISSYTNRSPKRCAELKDFQVSTYKSKRFCKSPTVSLSLNTFFIFFQELYEEEMNKILKMSGTRWLVLHPCVQRYLKSSESLLGFFRTQVREDPDDKQARKIFTDLSNPFTNAYMHFLDYAMNYFNEFNAMFQGKGVLIHKLESAFRTLMSKLGQNFLKPEELHRIETVNIMHPQNQVRHA